MKCRVQTRRMCLDDHIYSPLVKTTGHNNFTTQLCTHSYHDGSNLSRLVLVCFGYDPQWGWASDPTEGLLTPQALPQDQVAHQNPLARDQQISSWTLQQWRI